MLDLLHIELQIKLSIFTLLVCPSSCSSNLPAACLGALQIALKWFSLPQSPHILPYAGHLPDEWIDPQYLHGLTVLVLLSVCTASNTCFAHIRTWSLITSLDLLMVLRLLSIFWDILIVNAMDKWLFNWPIKLLILAFFCSYSYPLNPLLCIFTFISLEFTKLEGFDSLIIFLMLCLNESLPA